MKPLKIVVADGTTAAGQSLTRPASALDFESFGHAPLPGIRNPRLFAALGAAAVLVALLVRRFEDAPTTLLLILNALGTAALLLGFVCALRLRPTRAQLMLERRRLWRALCAASLRSALLTGAILAVLGVVAAVVAGTTDPGALLRLALTLLTIHLLFMTGSQWVYLRMPAAELAELVRLQQTQGLRWGQLWREVVVMLCGSAGAALVYMWPATILPLALAAMGTNAWVLRRHYLHADLV